MVKAVKKRIVKVLNQKLRYDTAVKIFYMFPQYRKNISKYVLNYKTALTRIQKETKKEKITIVFVCQLPSLWNGVSSIYESAKKNPDVNAYIVAIPEKKIGDETLNEYGDNHAYEFCKKIDGNTIDGYDYKKNEFFDLHILEPTYVFLPRPYDHYLPEEYRSYVINQYTKVCYIPYGYDITIWDSRYSYDMDFICNVYAIFAENEYYKNIVANIFRTLNCLSEKRVYNLGYPRFDLYKDWKCTKEKGYKKTVVWLPRWTTNPAVEATTFFMYKDIIVDYFRKRKDIKLICRPHPLMLRNFVASNLMTESEQQEFLDLFQTTVNFEYDVEGDYTSSFSKADIFISDYSSLLMEEILMDVPIIYTGQVKNFEKISLKLAEAMYQVQNDSELITQLDMLIADKDVLSEKRKEAQNMLAFNNYTTGEKIVAALIEDYNSIGLNVEIL